MTFHFGRELFGRKHRSAPLIPNLIESGKDWSGTIPKWGVHTGWPQYPILRVPIHCAEIAMCDNV